MACLLGRVQMNLTLLLLRRATATPKMNFCHPVFPVNGLILHREKSECRNCIHAIQKSDKENFSIARLRQIYRSLAICLSDYLEQKNTDICLLRTSAD